MVGQQLARPCDGNDLGVPRFIEKTHDFVGGFGDDASMTSNQASEGKLTCCCTDSRELNAPSHHNSVNGIHVHFGLITV